MTSLNQQTSNLAPVSQPTITETDLAIITEQLQRDPRGSVRVAARCACTGPLVVATLPRLPDGTPFPTTYYLTCPRLSAEIGTLESTGLMREMQDRLSSDPELAAAYESAHQRYLSDRNELGEVAELDGISAGGMPTRVKCLHVLAAQSLACGPGVNPLGDEVLALVNPWWHKKSCVGVASDSDTDSDLDSGSDSGSHSDENESVS